MRKRFVSVFILLTLAAFYSVFGGCASGGGNRTVENTLALWEVSVARAAAASVLAGSQSSLQYDGTLINIPLEQMPKAGCAFLLLEITVEKTGTGKGAFSWPNACVADAEGNRHPRHENDTFLDILGYKRIKATDITFGVSEGSACFEVPESALDGPLWFLYESDEGTVKILLDVQKEKK